MVQASARWWGSSILSVVLPVAVLAAWAEGPVPWDPVAALLGERAELAALELRYRPAHPVWREHAARREALERLLSGADRERLPEVARGLAVAAVLERDELAVTLGPEHPRRRAAQARLDILVRASGLAGEPEVPAEAVRRELIRLEAAEAAMAERYAPGHPVRVAMRKRMEELRGG